MNTSPVSIRIPRDLPPLLRDVETAALAAIESLCDSERPKAAMHEQHDLYFDAD